MDFDVLEFVKSEAGAAGLKAPQDDEAGHKAIAMMERVNKESSTDMVTLAETEYQLLLANTNIVELGPGAGYMTKAILARRPASIVAFELSPVFRSMLAGDEELAPALSSGALMIKEDDAITMSGVPTSSVSAANPPLTPLLQPSYAGPASPRRRRGRWT